MFLLFDTYSLIPGYIKIPVYKKIEKVKFRIKGKQWLGMCIEI